MKFTACGLQLWVEGLQCAGLEFDVEESGILTVLSRKNGMLLNLVPPYIAGFGTRHMTLQCCICYTNIRFIIPR